MDDMTCENCGNACGGILASSPKECGSWNRKPTESERAEMNGCEPVSFIPMGDVTDRGTRLWGPSFGLTKREEFAKAAMQAWRIANPTKVHDWVAENACKDADALLRALAHSAGGE